jgi:hypothetical protein
MQGEAKGARRPASALPSTRKVQTMFEGMDHVDWAHLWACGPGTEVPRLIRTLASSTDPAECKAAFSKLATELLLYQGGSILEVTPYAVPFLIELLTVETLEVRADVFALLALIVRARSFLIGAGGLDNYSEETAAPPELQARLAEEREWIHQACRAVEQGVPIYLTFLGHPAGDTRRWAAYLLSLFPDHAPITVPALQARLAQEDDLLVQAALVSSLGDLLEPETAVPQFLHPYLRAESPTLLRLVAALAYVRRARGATPPEAVQILLEVLAARETVEALYQQLPQVYLVDYYSFIPHVCETLAKVGHAQAIPALTAVLRALPSTAGEGQEPDYWEVCKVATSLVAAVLTGGELPTGARPSLALPLTQAQRTALTVLVEDDILWKPYAAQYPDYTLQLFTLHQFFEDYGVPASPEALSALLQARP